MTDEIEEKDKRAWDLWNKVVEFETKLRNLHHEFGFLSSEIVQFLDDNIYDG